MKTMVLIGRAPCWENDLNRLKEIVQEFDVMAVGLDCPYSGDVKYFVTYHPEDIQLYKEKRKAEGKNLDFKAIGHLKKPEIDIVEAHKSPSGSSSLMGAIVARKLGYNRVVLCGCPLEGDSFQKATPYSSFQKGWIARLSEVKDYVRSMSGWTSETLGTPTEKWINE
jgi:hypothetical protein